jgi:ribosomal protein S11
MVEKIEVWFDPEADFLEVRFDDVPGYMKATENDALMERVNSEGKVIGFSIMGVSAFRKDKPLAAELTVA